MGEGAGAENTDTVVRAAAQEPKSPVQRASVPRAAIPGAYIVPQGYRIAGNLSTSRPVVVDGELAGAKVVTNQLYVRSGGTVEAPAVVGSLLVEGTVSGPVFARDSVEVRSGGVVQGSLEAPSLTVAPGGIINGAQLSVGGGE